MTKLITPLPLAAIFAAFFCSSVDASQYCEVTDTNGDTVSLSCDDKTHRASIAFVSFPVEGQPMYQSIQKKLASMVGTKVSVKWSYSTNRMKSAILYRKGVNLNLAFIKSGWGYLSRSANSMSGYQSAQLQAKKKQFGVWSDPDQIHPFDYVQIKGTMSTAKNKLEFSEKMKATLRQSYVADKRTKIAYPGYCQEYLSIPNLYKIVFFTKRALKFKGYTVSNECNH